MMMKKEVIEICKMNPTMIVARSNARREGKRVARSMALRVSTRSEAAAAARRAPTESSRVDQCEMVMANTRKLLRRLICNMC